MSLRWQRRRTGVWFAWEDRGETVLAQATLFRALRLGTQEWLLEECSPDGDAYIFTTLKAAKVASVRRFNRNKRRRNNGYDD